LTLEKLEYYFDCFLPDLEENMLLAEVEEIAFAMRTMLPSREADTLIAKMMRLVPQDEEAP
jgi:hypothetical protein